MRGLVPAALALAVTVQLAAAAERLNGPPLPPVGAMCVRTGTNTVTCPPTVVFDRIEPGADIKPPANGFEYRGGSLVCAFPPLGADGAYHDVRCEIGRHRGRQ